jgi:CheY-like chemotaxis protein
MMQRLGDFASHFHRDHDSGRMVRRLSMLPGSEHRSRSKMSLTADAVYESRGAGDRPLRSTPRLLCVDDDPEISRIWKIRLTSHGVQVFGASNGEEGFVAAVEVTPDLILLDLHMPNEDGAQVLSRLRSDPRTQGIPVLMLTGGDISTAKRRTVGRDADDYLAKPVDFGVLLQKLAAYLPLRNSKH